MPLCGLLCRSALPPVDPKILQEYPKTHGHFRYRQERDGSVVLATPSGPRRFKNWAEFWQAVN